MLNPERLRKAMVFDKFEPDVMKVVSDIIESRNVVFKELSQKKMHGVYPLSNEELNFLQDVSKCYQEL